jgi:hypothetical protein
VQGEETQSKDAAKMSHQSKVGNSLSWQGIKMCFYCNKPGHIAQICDKAMNNEKEDAKNTKRRGRICICSAIQSVIEERL